MMLAIRPDLVQMAKAVEPAPVLESEWFNFEYGGKVGVFRRYHRLTAPGNMGAPKAGTQGKGEAMLAGVVADVVKFLDEFAAGRHCQGSARSNLLWFSGANQNIVERGKYACTGGYRL